MIKISSETLEQIEEEAFFSDIPVDRLLKVYEQAYHDEPPRHLSREQNALRRIKRLVAEKGTHISDNKTISVIKKVLNG